MLKTGALKPIFAAAMLMASVPSAWSGEFLNKTINIIHPPDSRPCTFFILDGVSAADPATPNTPWMALRQSHVGYRENLAVLMSAKLTGRPVQVVTTGAVVPECGHVDVSVIRLP
jgi:hypothetical protein